MAGQDTVTARRKKPTDFHRRGVRVFFPVMPWDQGTRDEGVPNWVSTARLMAEIGGLRSKTRDSAGSTTIAVLGSSNIAAIALFTLFST